MALTDEQKLEVLNLRAEGYGYKKTAEMIGVTRDQVRGFINTKTAHQLAENKNLVIDDVRKKHVKPPKEYVCKHCAVKYLRKNSDITSVVFCSLDCKRKERERARLEYLDKVSRCCVTCDVTFIPNSSTQKYCSKECSREVRACASCGERFDALRNSKTKTCSKRCTASNLKKTHLEYYKDFSDIHQGMIVPTSVYDGADYEMTAWCVLCQKESTRKAGQFTDKSRKRGCTHCNVGSSTGEAKVAEWLSSNDVKYVEQYKVDGLADKRALSYDFAVLNDDDEVVALIEYDGRQHYEPVKQFGGVKEFNRQLRSDEMKNNYAMDNNIKLIRISYKKKKQVDKILSREIQTAAIL